MSYDIEIVDEYTEELIKTKTQHKIRGATYNINGTNELTFNITFNYAPRINQILKGGIKSLNNKSVETVNTLLENALAKIPEDEFAAEVTNDYWEPTWLNIWIALTNLKVLCTLAPHDAIVKVYY